MDKENKDHNKISNMPFASNNVRLSFPELLIAGAILLGLFCIIPSAWKKMEEFKPGPDWRIPYSLGSDYWLYSQYCRKISLTDKTVLIGDSVIWGHYVKDYETLSHYLNEYAGKENSVKAGNNFVNMGIDGIHPVAMNGLVKNYAQDITGKKVIINCNLLWTSSKRHDLQGQKELSFNHPDLVPQFFPRIPCYRKSFSGRLGVVIDRNITFFSWAQHVRSTCFNSEPLSQWTIENPYKNPVAMINFKLPSPNEPPTPKPVAKSWKEKGLGKFNAHWVELDSSFQWKFLCRVIKTLEERGNKIFIMVGPFNEYMLTEESLLVYKQRISRIKSYMEEKKIPYIIPHPLPSKYYADASHPLAEGYKLLAEQFFENQSFRNFFGKTK